MYNMYLALFMIMAENQCAISLLSQILVMHLKSAVQTRFEKII